MNQSEETGIRGAIVARVGDFMGAIKRGDAAGLAALYTDDGQVLPPNASFVTGMKAIQAFWQAVMDMGIKEAKIDVLEVEGYGVTATEVGTFTLLGEGEQELDRGKYIVIWKREGGRWKLHRDIFNSSLPPPGS
jgi:uncharacterized protein (TIGR02246 family)